MPNRRAVVQFQGPARARAFVLAASLAAGPGCSYALVNGPRTTSIHGSERADAEWIAQTCTSSNAAPIVDTVLGTVLGALGGSAVVAGVSGAAESHHNSGSFSSSGFNFDFTPSPGALIGIGAAVTAIGGVLLGSAVTGFGRTADCRQAIERSIPRKLPPVRAPAPTVSASP
jgi:hypothetical protein